MTRRVISMALCLCMVLTMFPAEALAAELNAAAQLEPVVGEDFLMEGNKVIPAAYEGEDAAGVSETGDASSGICGDNVTWMLADDGTLTISGSGDMQNYYVGSGPFAPWISLAESIQKVVIEEGVASIGSGAFSRCSALTSVSIPDTVTRIGGYAFEQTDLQSVEIPVGVTVIEEGTFLYCSKLTNASLPSTLASIGPLAFVNCSSLVSITIPDNVTDIGDHAFSSCTSLTSITIPDGVASIGNDAFSDCKSLSNVSIPSSVTSIGNNAFSGCSKLTSVIIPDGVISIGGGAFSRCGLTNITISESVTSIGAGAFSWCDLTNVAIPNGVTNIGPGAFSYCKNLCAISVDESNGYYSSVEGVLFNRDQALLLCYPGGKSDTTYEIQDGVTSIGDSAFSDCSGLTSVSIPNSVTSIGSQAFAGCSSLTDIIIPDSVTAIGTSAFGGCTSLISVTILGSTTIIGEDAFHRVGPDFTLYCYPGSYAVEYAENYKINYELLGISGRTLSASLFNEDGAEVTYGFTVTWYDEDENAIGTSSALSGADIAKSYSFEIRLGDDLSMLYEQPERQTITPSDSANCEVRLVRKAAAKAMTLTGRVLDSENQPIRGAAVTIVPVDSGSIETATGTDGGFQAEVPCGIVSITIRKDGYYSKRETLDLTNETGSAYDAGIYTLTPVQVITDRLTLSVTQQRASEDPDTALELPLASLGAMRITLTGSGERPITDFETQNLALLFQPGAVSAGETITVTIDDPSGMYRAASASVTLDSSRLGNAELTMVQKGGFVLGGLSGPEANLLVFDSAGNCIQTSAAASSLTSSAMEPGTYQVVLLQKSELLRGVSHIDYLKTFGLRAGQDYLLRNITIADGKIVRLDDCTVPSLDDSRISYTITEGTSITTSKPSGIPVGELLLIRAAYELDPAKGVAASYLNIALPEGVALLESSVLIEGKTAAYTYDTAKREVSIYMSGRDKAVAWLYCTPAKSGSHSISAFLTLSNGACQPIGAAVVQAEDAKLEVPERTGKASGLTAAGKACPGSTVTLYDNDTEVGHATANAAGSWSMSFDLAQPVYSYSYHTIHAAIEGGNLTEPISTESVLVTYDKRLDLELTKITMYNTGDHGAQETVFDFTANTSTKTPYYRMWPSAYPTFTFKAEFSGDASKLSEVYVVTTNSAGDETYVKMAYDAASSTWVGTHDYDSFDDAPVAVTAAYSVEDDGTIPYDKEWRDDMERAFIETYQQTETILEPIFSELFSELINYTIVVERENYIEVAMSYTDSHTGESVEFGYCQIEVTSVMDEVTLETLDNSGYVLVDSTENIWVKIECTETDLSLICMNPNEQAQFTTTMHLNMPTASLGMRFMVPEKNLYIGEQIAQFGLAASSLLADSTGASILGNIGGLFAGMNGVEYSNKQWTNLLSIRLEKLVDNLWDARKLLEKRCTDGSRKLPDYAYYNLSLSLDGWEAAITDYGNDGWKYIRRMGIFDSVMNGYFTGISALAIQCNVAAAGGILSGWTMLDSGHKVNLALGVEKDPVERYIINQYNEINSAINDIKETIKATYQPCDSTADTNMPTAFPKATVQPSAHPVTYIADPSGYIYEAVPSNRLSGVTAVISSKSGGTWNASDYDQINPQTTGTDGSFYWDVPQGNWKVRFTKSGYQDADTSNVTAAVNGWLPVPPPQLDINVGMVSTAAPAVKQAVAYTDRVEVAFSQYMNISSVQNALSLTCNGAAVSNLVIEPLDAEYNLENTEQYAARFAVTTVGDNLSGNLVVSIANSAVNYAGKPLASVYTSETLTASVRPDSIVVQDTVSVGLHKKVDVAIALQPGIAAQKLVIENLSPFLIDVPGTVVTGADGSAVISVNGRLPGVGLLKITEPISGLSTTIAVNVSLDGEVEDALVTPVKAILEDGTVVTDGMKISYGKKITLHTDTSNAVIRYTLDDTCPCEETALTYDTPITFTGNIVLRAAAYKDGVYSKTIRLDLHIDEAGSEIDPTPEFYQVVFDSQGGSAVSSIFIYSGGKVTRPADPTRSGYTFGGWYKESSCTNAWDFTSDTVTGNITLYACWTYNGGGGGSSSDSGFSSSESGSSSSSNYSITVPSRVTGGTVKVSHTSASAGTKVTITATPNSGYELDTLTVTDAGGNQVRLTEQGNHQYTFTMPKSKVTVAATFKAATPVTPTAVSFIDVLPDAYYYDAVTWAVNQSITAGTSATTFSPDSPCTRGQIVTFLWRAAGSPAVGGNNPFTDVNAGDYWYNAVLWAVSKGITTGTSATTFSPNDTCTRGQTVTFLYRNAGSPTVTTSATFTDVALDAYYSGAVAWALAKNITNGTTASTFSPQDQCARGQIVTFLYRSLAE